jgi:hypothetical protein
METTERIVEAYVRYIKGWATIPNIRCAGQLEIDLLAINPLTLERYHIESGVSISGAYSKLTDKPFSEKDLKERVKKAGQRRTVGYFVERKFGVKGVKKTLEGYGFKDDNYAKVIVSWGWTKEAEDRAKAENVVLWDFRLILKEIAEKFKDKSVYFTDDTLRTLHLFSHTIKGEKL